MDRRAFLGTLTGALLAAPLAVEARQASGNEARGSVTDRGVAATNTCDATW
jgi:hypothetical protein